MCSYFLLSPINIILLNVPPFNMWLLKGIPGVEEGIKEGKRHRTL
jgi:hypothetical protein